MASPPKEKYIPFNEQAFLWDFIDVFKNSAAPKAPGPGANTPTIVSLCKYKNFLQLEDKEPYITINRLLGEGASGLHGLKSSQLSSLVPYVKIYKTIKNEKGEERDIQFPFSDFTTAESITDSILDRGIDVGLKNVVWRDVGVNPADVGVMFEGQIDLFFQSFEAIFKNRMVDGVSLSFADMVDHTAALGAGPKVAITNVVDPTYTIKLEVGWSVPDDPGNVLDLGDISSQITSMRRSYIIEFMDQQLNVNTQDGSVILNLRFCARNEAQSMGTTCDILYIDPLKVSKENTKVVNIVTGLNQQEADLRTRREEVAKMRTMLAKTTPSKAKWVRGAHFRTDLALKELIKEVKELEGKISKSKSEKRTVSYQRIFNVLRTQKSQSSGTGVGKMKYFDLDDPLYQTYIDFLKLAAETKKEDDDELSAGRTTTIADGQKTLQRKEEFKKEREARFSEIKKGLSEAMNAGGGLEGDVKAVKLPSKPEDKDPTFVTPLLGTKRRIKYMFLGDIVEAVMEIIHQRPRAKFHNLSDQQDNTGDGSRRYKSQRLLLGTLIFENPVTNATPLPIALADIPVSLNYFDAWFYEHVVKGQLTTYVLKSFLKDLCATLISNLLSPARYGPFGTFNSPQTSVQSIWVERESELNTYWTDNYNKLKDRINLDKLVHNKTIKAGDVPSAAKKKVDEWLFLYVVGSSSTELAKVPKDQTRTSFNGLRHIPHYFIGGPFGLLKDISFSRTTIPFRFEASLSQADTKVRKNLLFQDKYDVRATFFGNPVFKPGMLIFIDPKGLGLGASVREPIDSLENSDFRFDLGIGGYYRIVRVFNTLSDGTFESVLETVAELDLRDIKNINKKSVTTDWVTR